MRTQLSIVVVAAGIVGTITAGTVSANVLMNRDTASMSAMTAASQAAPAAPVVAPVAPVRTVLAPRAAASAPTVTRKAATRRAVTRKAAARRGPITYVVKSGDDLSSIAQWFALHGYGDLFQANRAVIGDDPDLILPGQRITISGVRMTVR